MYVTYFFSNITGLLVYWIDIETIADNRFLEIFIENFWNSLLYIIFFTIYVGGRLDVERMLPCSFVRDLTSMSNRKPSESTYSAEFIKLTKVLKTFYH